MLYLYTYIYTNQKFFEKLMKLVNKAILNFIMKGYEKFLNV